MVGYAYTNSGSWVSQSICQVDILLVTCDTVENCKPNTCVVLHLEPQCFRQILNGSNGRFWRVADEDFFLPGRAGV
jgi:hypothetical protein